MRPTPWLAAEPYRVENVPRPDASRYGDDFGWFEVPHHRTGVTLGVMASCGGGWDHVSVSLPKRCPNWPEMHYVKGLFWSEDEAVMQLHPPESDYRSFHPYCLHLWRPHDVEIPLPPGIMVAPESAIVKGTG